MSFLAAALFAGGVSVAVTAVTSGFAAVTLATFLTPALISLGTGLLARAFAPKPPGFNQLNTIASQRAARSVGAISGTASQNINSAISPARWILGQVRCTGRIVWMMVHDDDVFTPRTTVPGGWVSNARYDTGDETTFTVDDVENIYESTIDNNVGNEPPGTGWKFVDTVANVTKRDTVSDLHMALVLSEGECEGIDEIWIDGEEITITKSTENGHSVYKADGFECHEYFSADGTEGAESFAAAAAGNSELTWDASSVQAKGLSWVYVKLTQSDYGSNYDNRRYSQIPNIEFVVKGLKLGSKRNPAAGTKAWTENAAIIRKWWLTDRRGANWRDINNTYYNAAVARCDTTIDISNLTGFDSTAMQSNLKRYTINGLVHSGDDVTAIEQDFDFAWDGSIVEWDGDILFRPGGERLSVREIVPDDMTDEPIYRPGTTLHSNRYVCNLPQSEWHDWLPYDIRVDDTGKQAYDGEIQTLNLGATEFVTNPAQAANLLRSAARRARASSGVEITLKPGDDFSATSIIPGDKITMQMPELGISDQEYFVLDTKILEGWAVKLVLTEWGPDWYDDDISLEHYSPRQVIPTSGRGLVAPSPVTANIVAATDDDGKFSWYALITAPETLFELFILYKLVDNENYQEWSSFSNQTVINLTQAGDYEFLVHLRSRDGRISPPTRVTATAGFDINLPPLPVLARKGFEGGFARWVFTNLGKFVNGIEIAYTYQAPGSTSSPGLLNAAGWDAADKLGQYAIIPAKALTDERTIVQLLPSFGSYNFYARGIDIAGRETDLVHLGLIDYTLDAPTNVDVDVYGDGTRAYLFTLPNNESVAGCQIRFKKAGDFIPEPGPIENAPPTLIAANSTADGDIILAYSEPLDESSSPAVASWMVQIGGTNYTPSSITIDSNTVELTLPTKIVAGDVVLLDFTNPGSNPLQDTHDEAAADFDDHPVNNTLRGIGHETDWLSMERLHEGYITASPYLAKLPGAGIWDVAFRTQSISGHLSDIARVQVNLGEPVQLDIVTAVQQAIADNPALVTLTDEVTRAQAAEAKARAAAVEAEASKTAAETAKKAAELAETAAEQAETNVNTALGKTETARTDAETAASEAEAEALKSADSASAAATSASAAAGSATTASNQATASEGSATSSATQASAAAASATAAGRSATAAAGSASTATTKASEASSSASAARTDRLAAQTAKGDAETAKADAESAETSAVSAKNDAESAESAATTQASNAAKSATAAGESATAASRSASTAASEATGAAQSASAAQTAETNAETAQSKAETAESNAASSASAADGSADAAAASLSSVKASATAAETAKDEAETAKDDAETAEGNASSSASAAAESAKTAKASADDAGTDASAASAARTAAETAQGKAETAETNAASSASDADGSAKAAASSASGVTASVNAAKGSADAAKVSENNAASSATAAASSATDANASKDAAGTSAAAAATSATSAATEAATAGTAAQNAATSQTAADGSAQAAATSAQAAAASATLASGAGDSATAAATSAQTATAKATEAAASASAAETSKTEAATSAANASTSETNAAASETTASSAASLATTEKEAAAGFAGDAKQAVAGVTQTASAAVNSALQTTFASIVSLRAIAGESKAKFELVALSDPSGSRAAGVITGDLQSFDYAPAKGTIPGAFAHGEIVGIYAQATPIGVGGNIREVEIRKRRDPSQQNARTRITSTTSGNRRIVYLTDDLGTGARASFKRADIANAIRGASFINTTRVIATGDLGVALATDGSRIDERVALITLSGGRDNRVVENGAGWILRRNGSGEFDAALIRGKLKANQIETVGLTATGITASAVNFDTATITGTLTADHISSDVRNWTKLAGSTTLSFRTDPSSITTNVGANVTGYDFVYVMGSCTGGGSQRWYAISSVKVSAIPTSNPGVAAGYFNGFSLFLRKDSAGNLFIESNMWRGWTNPRVEEIWGINDPDS